MGLLTVSPGDVVYWKGERWWLIGGEMRHGEDPFGEKIEIAFFRLAPIERAISPSKVFTVYAPASEIKICISNELYLSSEWSMGLFGRDVS